MVESGGPSWYLRVDTGMMRFDRPEIQVNGIYDLVETSIHRAWTLGGGFGTYFTRNVRGELSYDHKFGSDVQGRLADPNATIKGVGSFGLESDILMGSLYYDFTGISNRFTPYVGIGLGAVHHSTKEGAIVSGCGCVGTIGTDSKWDMAAALMTGASIKLRGGEPAMVQGGSIKDAPVYVSGGNALYLDVGYRFLYLGEAPAGAVNAKLNGQTTTVVAKDLLVDSIHGHEFRIGLRYDIR